MHWAWQENILGNSKLKWEMFFPIFSLLQQPLRIPERLWWNTSIWQHLTYVVLFLVIIINLFNFVKTVSEEDYLHILKFIAIAKFILVKIQVEVGNVFPKISHSYRSHWEYEKYSGEIQYLEALTYVISSHLYLILSRPSRKKIICIFWPL